MHVTERLRTCNGLLQSGRRGRASRAHSFSPKVCPLRLAPNFSFSKFFFFLIPVLHLASFQSRQSVGLFSDWTPETNIVHFLSPLREEEPRRGGSPEPLGHGPTSTLPKRIESGGGGGGGGGVSVPHFATFTGLRKWSFFLLNFKFVPSPSQPLEAHLYSPPAIQEAHATYNSGRRATFAAKRPPTPPIRSTLANSPEKERVPARP